MRVFIEHITSVNIIQWSSNTTATKPNVFMQSRSSLCYSYVMIYTLYQLFIAIRLSVYFIILCMLSSLYHYPITFWHNHTIEPNTLLSWLSASSYVIYMPSATLLFRAHQYPSISNNFDTITTKPNTTLSLIISHCLQY